LGNSEDLALDGSLSLGQDFVIKRLNEAVKEVA
jgi:hypothetical protein